MKNVVPTGSFMYRSSMSSYDCSWKTCNTSTFNPNYGDQFGTTHSTTYVDNCTTYSLNLSDNKCYQEGCTYYMKNYSYYDNNGNIITVTQM